MLRIDAGIGVDRYCDGMSRRSFVKVGVAGMATAALADVLRAREATAAAGGARKDTSVILLWLDGGPSHMDLYDLKPEAPAEYRGIWRPIPTNVPGLEISELFPLQAKVADKFSLVRSLHHDSGDHFTGAHYMLTGRGNGVSGADTRGRSPSIGSIAARVCGPRRAGLPPYVAVPYGMSVGIRPGYFGANYVGLEHNPFETEGDPNQDQFRVRNIELPGGFTVERLADRRRLASAFDQLCRRGDEEAYGTIDRFDRQAFDLVTGSAARKAFDIASEDAAVRERYGRHPWGQSTLLARRLVEAGSTFVTAHFGGWDHHWNLKEGMESLLPIVDRAVSALFEDLDARGLLERVLVVLCGEFSRTPRMNDGSGQGTPGRDHWGSAMFCLLGGGGVRGGRVVGATDRLGEYPRERPITPADIHATIYRVLGVDSSQSFLDHAGRPVPAVDKGAVIEELF